MLCKLGFHSYKKTDEKQKGNVITEYFTCKRCTKQRTHSYNPYQKYRCEYCGEGEDKCLCNAC